MKKFLVAVTLICCFYKAGGDVSVREIEGGAKCNIKLKDLNMKRSQIKKLKSIILSHSLKKASHACFELNTYQSFSICSVRFDHNHIGTMWILWEREGDELMKLPLSEWDFVNKNNQYILDSLVVKAIPFISCDPRRVEDMKAFVNKEKLYYDEVQKLRKVIIKQAF